MVLNGTYLGGWVQSTLFKREIERGETERKREREREEIEKAGDE